MTKNQVFLLNWIHFQLRYQKTMQSKQNWTYSYIHIIYVFVFWEILRSFPIYNLYFEWSWDVMLVLLDVYSSSFNSFYWSWHSFSFYLQNHFDLFNFMAITLNQQVFLGMQWCHMCIVHNIHDGENTKQNLPLRITNVLNGYVHLCIVQGGIFVDDISNMSLPLNQIFMTNVLLTIMAWIMYSYFPHSDSYLYPATLHEWYIILSCNIEQYLEKTCD